MNLNAEVEEELLRLKSIESTLDLLQLSAKKQLTQYLSSAKKKSRGSSSQEEKKENADINGLSEIKVNLYKQFQEIDKDNAKLIVEDKEKMKSEMKRMRENLQLIKNTMKTIKNSKKSKKSNQNENERRKLNKSLDLLRCLRDFERHIKRHQVKITVDLAN